MHIGCHPCLTTKPTRRPIPPTRICGISVSSASKPNRCGAPSFQAPVIFVERLAKEGGGDLKATVDLAYRSTIGRKPAAKELDRALTYVGSDPANLKGLGWLLFNLDEFLFVK